MLISRKTRYALKGLFQLAASQSIEPVKVSKLAEAQGIPPRFLELIFTELKQAGFVESRRGNEGGYLLTSPPEMITVGEVIRFIQGENILADSERKETSTFGSYALNRLWKGASDAVSETCDTTTLADLVNMEMENRQQYIPNYTI